MTQTSGYPDRESKIIAKLEERRALQGVTFQRLSLDRLTDLVMKLTKQPVKFDKPAVLELSSRHPYDETLGRIDVLEPGRWDTESNLIFMLPIVTGPSLGEWDGSVIYGTFKAPANASYLFVGNFSGYDTTMKLNGPWGTATAYTAVTSDVGVVTAIWTGSGPMSFTMSCSGQVMGYVESIQIFTL